MYNDWKTAYDAGQYSGTFEQYSREKYSNQLMLQIKSDYQNTILFLRSCHVTRTERPYAPSSPHGQSDITNASKELATTQKQLMIKKIKHTNNSNKTSFRTVQGTWDQYAKDNFLNLPEVTH